MARSKPKTDAAQTSGTSSSTLLSIEEVALYKQLPMLTLEQIARVLQKTEKQTYEMTRSRSKHPLPVFKAGRTICSTWAKIQQWIEEGFLREIEVVPDRKIAKKRAA